MGEATNRRIVMAAMMVATFLAAIEGTVVSTAMPTIVGDLHGMHLMNWVFSVYFLLSAVTVPVFGKLADLFGRKKIFITGTFIFLIGSTLCGLSQSMVQLIAFRVIQGIGAGALLPVTATIVADIYPYEQRAKMLGFISLVWGISGVAGPLVGGFFVDQLTWHWIFFINIPFGITTVIMVTIFFKENVEKTKKRIDYWGALTFSAGMFFLLYAFQKGGEANHWTSPAIPLLFMTAFVLLALFIWIETKVKEPMIPLHLFRIRTISVANVIAFFVTAVLIGTTVYMPMWIQGVLGYGATVSGFVVTPMSVLWTTSSFIGGRLLVKKGVKFTAILGIFFLLVGTLLLAMITTSTPLMALPFITAIQGIAFGLVITITTVTVQSAVGWSMRGVATASNTFFRNLGQTIGVALLGTYFNAKMTANLRQQGAIEDIDTEQMNELINPHTTQALPENLRTSLKEALVFGIHHVFTVLILIALIALIMTLLLPRQQPVGDHR